MERRLTRAEVDQQATWKLEDLFANDEAWEAALGAVLADLPSVTQYHGRLLESGQVLAACLEAQESLYQRLALVTTYTHLRQSEDSSNAVNQANASKAASASANVAAALSFIDSEILAFPDGVLETYIANEPKLTSFKKNLTELLEVRPYRLSAETEAVLAALSEVHASPYTIYQRGKLSDMEFDQIVTADGQEQPVSFALYEDHYEFTPNTDERRKAYVSFGKTLNRYKNTFAATYAAEVKKQVVMARQRGYASVTDMLLQPQQVTRDMYNNLHDIIQTDLAPHMRRLAKLRQRLLGLDEMRHCDLKVPLDVDFSPETSYAEASDIIKDALRILGPEYSDIMHKALTERWVDLPENVGKSTGAFCSSPYGSHPFILVTWTKTMRGAFVLAHELGHAGHFALANKYQRMANVRPSMYFIEAPSTMNEQLLGHHILAKSSDTRMRRWVILQFLGTYYHNFVTHMLEAELQRRVYARAEAGQPLTAKLLCELKGNVLEEFWGDAVVIDDTARLTWMRQPHYYMGLYPYTYAAGLTASTAIAKRIREEGQPAVDRWLEALKAGGTLKPLELLKLAGVDMSKPDPIREAVAYVGTLVDELEKSFADDHEGR